MVPIAEYSRDCLKRLRADTGIDYDERAQGTLQLFRTHKQLDGIGKDVEILKEYGVPFEVLDRAGSCRVEPALVHTQAKFVDALRLPNDETGDCFKFTRRLAAMAQARGATFSYDTRIEAFAAEGGRISGVRASAGLGGRGLRRCLRLHARHLFAADTRAPRHRAAGVPGKGLLDHGANHQCRASARVDDHGRDAQGRGHTARRSHPCRRHGGTGRRQPDAARSAPSHARACRHRPFPWRR